MAGLIFLIIIVGIFMFLQYYNPHHWYISELDTPPDSLVFLFCRNYGSYWIYHRLLDTTRTLRILPMGQPQEEKKVDRYNILRKGKVIFWNVTERELFDIMEDLAVETYYNKDLTAKDISYEPVNENTEKS